MNAFLKPFHMKKPSDLELELLVQIEEDSEHKVTPAHLREALRTVHYQLDNKRKEVYLRKGKKRIMIEKQEAVDHVISCMLSNFPDLYSEEAEEASLPEVPNPLAVERETRRQRKREKLALALQRDDAEEGKKALAMYFSFLEEDPQLSLPGKDKKEERQQYLNDLFNGPVYVFGRRVILEYLDDLETVAAKAGADVGTAFAQASPRLYNLLSPPSVDQMVSSILNKVSEYNHLPEQTPASEKEGQWKEILCYTALGNSEAKLYFAAMLEQEHHILRQDFRSLQQGEKEYKEELTRAEREYEELSNALELEKNNANGYQELLLAERRDKERIISEAPPQYQVIKNKISRPGIIAGLVLAVVGALGISYLYHQNLWMQREMGILERKCEMQHWEDPITP